MSRNLAFFALFALGVVIVWHYTKAKACAECIPAKTTITGPQPAK